MSLLSKLDNFIDLSVNYNCLDIKYILPIQDYSILYTLSDYQRGGNILPDV